MDPGDELALAKVENFFFAFFPPQCGHSGCGWFRLRTSFSKVLPHLGQEYSKIGMPNYGYSFVLESLVSPRLSPDGG